MAAVRCRTYRDGNVLEALREAVTLLGGMERFVRPGEKILVKPNLLAASLPERAVCTHPEVVRAVVMLVQEAGGLPVAGDSPGVGSLERVAAECGIARVCEETGAPLVSFRETVEVSYPQGAICKRFTLAAPVREVDGIISVAKLKTHGLTAFTGAVKNLFGCVPGTYKPQFHLRLQQVEDFAGMLVDLYSLLRPRLSIIDGVVGMEGPGPRNGHPRPVGVILAGADGVAVDAAASFIIGLDPLRVPTTRIASQRGVGVGNPDSIEVAGTPLTELRVADFLHSTTGAANTTRLPPALSRWLQRQLTARPSIRRDLCTGCETCRHGCPPGVIELVDGKARVRDEGCIRCYCCHELCPKDAVALRKGWLLRGVESCKRIWGFRKENL